MIGAEANGANSPLEPTRSPPSFRSAILVTLVAEEQPRLMNYNAARDMLALFAWDYCQHSPKASTISLVALSCSVGA